MSVRLRNTLLCNKILKLKKNQHKNNASTLSNTLKKTNNKITYLINYIEQIIKDLLRILYITSTEYFVHLTEND